MSWGVPEKEQEVEYIVEEIVMENLLNLVKEIELKPQEAQKILKTRNPNRPTSKSTSPSLQKSSLSFNLGRPAVNLALAGQEAMF